MEILDRFWATFSPRRQDNLPLDVLTATGLTCEWQAGWIIESGEYAGQFACLPLVEYGPNEIPAFSWVPQEDLIMCGDDT